MGTILESFDAVRIPACDLHGDRGLCRDVPEPEEKRAGAGWAVFDIDGRNVIPQTHAADDPERAPVGRLPAVSFAVDDIDGACRNLIAGGVSIPRAARDAAGFPRDPDGNTLTLVGRRHP